MGKLWKHEWKYHLSFVVLVTVILFCWCHLQGDYYFWGSVENYDGMEKYVVYEVLNTVGWISYDVSAAFFYSCVWVIMLALVIKKGIIFLQENHSYGREFFESLPVTRKERFIFHLCMDSISIVVPMLTFTFFEYISMSRYLGANDIVIPWLLESLLGVMLVTISYLFMLLGVLYIMDAIFVTGFLKIACLGGFLLLTERFLAGLFTKVNDSSLVQSIYGFFCLETVGGNRYTRLEMESPHLTGILEEYMHTNISPDIFYKGEAIVYTDEIVKYVYDGDFSAWNRLCDFANLRSYILFVLAYLVIGGLLIALSKDLIQKRDVSKIALYYNNARFGIAGVLAGGMFLAITDRSVETGTFIINVVASVLVFLILSYFLDENRKSSFSKQRVVKQ